MPQGSAAVVAIVVDHNAGEHLSRCLESLAVNGLGRGGRSGTVIVVDNGSSAPSRVAAETAGATWLPAGSNLGYGRAANLGAGTAAGRAARFLLVCNPDVELARGALDALLGAMQADPALGAVGPKLHNPDGSVYPSARTFPDLLGAIGHGALGLFAPGNRFTRKYRMTGWDHSQPAHVDWVSGACFLVRREAWDSVGGFDPSYFMYMEDVDLCWRLGRSGWAILYEPRASAVHVQGASTSRHPYRMLAAHHRSMWRFARRTTTGGRRAALPVVAAGLVVRFAVAVAEHRLTRPSACRPLPAVDAAATGEAPLGPLP